MEISLDKKCQFIVDFIRSEWNPALEVMLFTIITNYGFESAIKTFSDTHMIRLNDLSPELIDDIYDILHTYKYGAQQTK